MKFRRVGSLGNGFTGLGMELFNDGWKVSQKGEGEKYDISVPGNVRLSLMENDIIPDPFIAQNNEESQWVSLVEWEYANKLDLKSWMSKILENLPDGGLLHLCFDAIDYDASFFIDNEFIDRQKGMFSPTKLICGIENEKKPEKASLDMKIKFHIQPFWRQHAVKSQMSFGWDFAPEIRTIGIWKDIRISYTGPAFFSSAYVFTLPSPNQKEEDACNVILRTKICIIDPKTLQNVEKPMKLHLKVILEDQEKIIPIEVKSNEDFEINLGVCHIPRWNPWSLGEPKLAPIKLQLISEGNIFDEFRGKIINRQIKWVRNPGTIRGHEDWTLEVNGKKMFLRGINWVPPDSLYGRISRERYVKLVDMAKDMNIDIIRVWGGGIAEKREFYEYCDEVGMMVWQEFPFACTNYPDYPEYMEVVVKECNGIVERTRNHPSVVVYCGGNEFNPLINSHIIKAVRGAVSEYAPDRFCFAVSPFQGDDHNWRFWGMRRMLDAYEVNGVGPFQMLTEYGMQASPNYETLKVCLSDPEATKLEEIEKDFLYHKGDYSGHRDYAKKYNISFDDISSFIKHSQELQAYALKYAIEVCRSAWPNVSGVFPWQHSDPWPNISWSVVDYYFRPKLAYKMLKTSYSPILPMVRNWRKNKDNKTLHSADIIIHNSTQTEFKGRCKYQIILNGKERESKACKIKVSPDVSAKLTEITTEKTPGTIIRMKIFDGNNKLIVTNFDFPAMDPVKNPMTKVRDSFDARFDGWWRKHMTYLMEIDKIKEERPNWENKRKRTIQMLTELKTK